MRHDVCLGSQNLDSIVVARKILWNKELAGDFRMPLLGVLVQSADLLWVMG
jgi:hypothetical protein